MKRKSIDIFKRLFSYAPPQKHQQQQQRTIVSTVIPSSSQSIPQTTSTTNNNKIKQPDQKIIDEPPKVQDKPHSILTNIQQSITINAQQNIAIPKKSSNSNNNNNSAIDEDFPPCSTRPLDFNIVPSNSFYRRPLPETLTAFSSPYGRVLFQEALKEGCMEGYFPLAEQFVSQSEPAFCGLATLAMSLNALYIDPNRLWKGPWRWFSEDMFDCCTPIDAVKKRGVTFSEFACLAKCNGASIQAFRADESTLGEFRSAVIEASTTQNVICVVSYSRLSLGQTGNGHYSPIGGYHPKTDLVLVMDVARFKYAPHWVSVETLWKAMLENDEDTHRPRGYFLLRQNAKNQGTIFCILKSPNLWTKVAHHFLNVIPDKLREKEHSLTSVEQVLEEIFSLFPVESSKVLQTYPEELSGRLHPDHMNALNSFFQQISQTRMYKIVSKLVESSDTSNPFRNQPYGAHVATLLLLACPAQLYSTLPNKLREEMSIIRELDSLPSEIRNEIMQIREQMFQVRKSPCKCSALDTGLLVKQKNHEKTCG